ncbi:hypothetical protein [Actinacidiphila sp. ITFR-21]|uniref:hypothetical protein n=1 Tax=Actinacidiphila sp. ITFR-21 TaxID=3075199 RepID=UPI00288BB0D1|nr:hypothetical protein [Streptomyces sp. ITFR-21]WNI15904.1 hypothetical protein RLT57_10485 [Streptomyces sp. ITFR-21]
MSLMLVRKRRVTTGVAVLAGTLALAACGSGSDGKDAGGPTGANGADDKPATSSSVSWPAPADASAQVKAAGLPMLGQEGQVLHIHSHLDVFVDGKAVTVPAEIGIDLGKQQISPLHTHDTSGVVHIESPVKADFTLGQFMAEWNVPISKDALGPLKTGGGKELGLYVNGKKQTGDPAAVTLGAHDEIAVVYGAAGDKVTVPGSYDWPEGL